MPHRSSAAHKPAGRSRPRGVQILDRVTCDGRWGGGSVSVPSAGGRLCLCLPSTSLSAACSNQGRTDRRCTRMGPVRLPKIPVACQRGSLTSDNRSRSHGAHGLAAADRSCGIPRAPNPPNRDACQHGHGEDQIEVKTLLVLNDPAYVTERSYNRLRDLAGGHHRAVIWVGIGLAAFSHRGETPLRRPLRTSAASSG
jgi:hypothetical protein